MKIGVTGHPGVGKTTLVLRVVERVPLKCGGMITKEIRKIGRRVGFSVHDVLTGKEGVLAHIHLERGPKLGRYRINLRDLDEVGAAAIERALAECDLIVVDEVGPMELHSERFIRAVERALESDKHLLVTVHRASNHHLAYRIRHEVDHFFRLTATKRDRITEEIIGLLLRAAGARRGN
ncbi:NTPase [Candidatus Bipolaricaulota sp. J31]